MPDRETQPLLPPNEAHRGVKTPPWRTRWWIAILGSITFVALLSGFGYLLWKSTDSAYRHTEVKWEKCDDKIYCGRLEVPLDYDNPSLGSASLFITKYPHTTRRKLGTLFSNPGGPGSSGSAYTWRTGEAHSNLTGGGYDIIGWDPRGVNMSTPRASCFSNDLKEAQWLSTLPLRYELPSTLPGAPKISTAERRKVYEEQLGMLLDNTRELAKNCEGLDTKDKKSIWNYMDTSSTARDIAFMADLFDGKNSPINFWGKSYGTFMGEYLISMFPDRVGRVIIDGVGDPRRWANTPNYQLSSGWFGNAEDTLKGFFDACAEAGEACPLTKDLKEPSSAAIRKKVDDLIIELQDSPRPLPLEAFGRTYNLTSGIVTDLIFQAMSTPRLWPSAASDLQEIFNSNPLPAFLSVESFTTHSSNGSLPGSTLPFAEFGVECSDTLPYNTNPAKAKRYLAGEKMGDVDEQSKHFGGLIAHTCSAWPRSRREKEGFRGPWGVELANEIIIISVTADPMAPISQTKVVQKIYKGQTRTIWQKGFGHCSPSQASLCTAQKVRAFYSRGRLPPVESSCQVSDPNPWFALKALDQGMSDDDRGLLAAMRLIGVVDL